MRKRKAKKILKNKEQLNYSPQQIKAAEQKMAQGKGSEASKKD